MYASCGFSADRKTLNSLIVDEDEDDEKREIRMPRVLLLSDLL